MKSLRQEEFLLGQRFSSSCLKWIFSALQRISCSLKKYFSIFQNTRSHFEEIHWKKSFDSFSNAYSFKNLPVHLLHFSKNKFFQNYINVHVSDKGESSWVTPAIGYYLPTFFLSLLFKNGKFSKKMILQQGKKSSYEKIIFLLVPKSEFFPVFEI